MIADGEGPELEDILLMVRILEYPKLKFAEVTKLYCVQGTLFLFKWSANEGSVKADNPRRNSRDWQAQW